jgi:hypothetical protein
MDMRIEFEPLCLCVLFSIENPLFQLLLKCCLPFVTLLNEKMITNSDVLT